MTSAAALHDIARILSEQCDRLNALAHHPPMDTRYSVSVIGAQLYNTRAQLITCSNDLRRTAQALNESERREEVSTSNG